MRSDGAIPIAALVGFVVFAVTAAGQPSPFVTDPSSEHGFRLMRNYTPEDHHAGGQSFSIAEDDRGVIYVGNLAGVLEYDGEWWRQIPIPNGSAAFSLARNTDGTILVGGIDEFGQLVANEDGTIHYESLSASLPAEQQEFGETRRIHVTSHGVYFVTPAAIFRRQGGSCELLREFEGDRVAIRSFLVGDDLYASTPEGLLRLEGETFDVIEEVGDQPIDMILPVDDERVVIRIRGAGFFQFDGATLTPFAEATTSWISSRDVSSSTRLIDGRFVVATRRSGVLFLHDDGSIDEILDSNVGLPDDDVIYVYAARDGSLWLATNTDVTRIDALSPLSAFDERNGLIGGPNAVARWRDVLYIGTSHGLFFLEPRGAGLDPGLQAPTLARPVAGANTFTFSLAPTEEGLLLGTRGSVRLLTKQGLSTVSGTEGLTIYEMFHSDLEPDRTYLGMREGLGVLALKNGEWTWAGLVEEAPGYITTLTMERPGELWIGSVFDGAATVTWDGTGPPRVQKLGDGESNVHRLRDRIVVSHIPEILRLDASSGTLVPDEGFRAFFDRGIFHMVEDEQGNVWMNSSPISVARLSEKGTYDLDDRTLLDLPGRDIQMIAAEAGGIIWIGNERGLFRYEANTDRTSFDRPNPLVRRVSLDRGRVLFAGRVPPDGQTEPEIETRELGRIRFECAAASYEPGVQYQYRLDPLDADWSDWTEVPFTEFTALREGRYVFRVRSKGLGPVVSGEGVYSFVVLAPWYRTPWAYGLFTLGLILVLGGISQLRHRNLTNLTKQLEGQISERTDELRRTVGALELAKVEVEDKNEELERANARLRSLSLHDALTGVANRRHLEETLKEEWNRAWRRRSPLAFILLDLDSFKALNDTRGHQEGDECLKKVAETLESHVKRGGELVARYGGEEFAIVLPGTKLDDAWRLADRIRAEIEALDIRNEGSAFGRITASFGVVAKDENQLASIDALVEAADKALYRAKANGRNRVASV